MPRFSALMLVAAASAASVLAGCSTQTIRVKVFRPAVVNLTKYNRVAVDDFQGNCGRDVSEDLSIALTGATDLFTGGRSLEVVDRSNLDKILRELALQRGDAWDGEKVSRLGRLIAAAVLIHGRVITCQTSEQVVQQPYVDEQGKQHISRQRQAIARLTVFLQASDIETGRVLDNYKYDEQNGAASLWTEGVPDGIDHASLLGELRRRIVSAYLKRILPYAEYVDVSLYLDKKVPQLKLGNIHAQSGNWDQAIASYQEALGAMTGELAELRYKGLFNLGVAYEYSNRFEEARKALQEAYALEQSGLIESELQRVNQREEEYRRLTEDAPQDAV